MALIMKSEYGWRAPVTSDRFVRANAPVIALEFLEQSLLLGLYLHSGSSTL